MQFNHFSFMLRNGDHVGVMGRYPTPLESPRIVLNGYTIELNRTHQGGS